MLAIDFNIGDIVLEDGRDVDLKGREARLARCREMVYYVLG